MQQTSKRFVSYWLFATVVLLVTAVPLVTVAVFNVLVDSSGAFLSLHLKSFEPLRYLNHDRVHKAELARRGGWDCIILGSSRAKAGFPATYPLLATNPTCNLGLDAPKFPEVAMAFDYARRHSHLKHVILCLDLYTFERGVPWIQDFPESRFNPNVNMVEYYGNRLFGWPATKESWKILRQKCSHFVPSPLSRYGFFDHNLPAGMSQRQLFDTVLRITGVGGVDHKVDWSYLDLFRHIVRVCRDDHIDLQVAIMPVHALELECAYAGGRWPDFEKWKAALVNVLAEEGVEGQTRLWDFTGYAGPSSEPVPPLGDVTTRMNYFYENSHCTPVLGALMLDAMYGAPGANQCGVPLSRSNLTAHLSQILKDRAVYARTNAADIQWVQRLFSEAAAARK
jgi:hypothetical protein